MPKVLVIDDEASIRKAIAISLRSGGYEVVEAAGKTESEESIRQTQFDVIVSDLFVPTEADGMTILKACRNMQPETPVLVMTAHGSIDRAVEAVKAGADDFLSKGFSMEEFKFRITRLLEQKTIKEKNLLLEENFQRAQRELQGRFQFGQIMGNSKATIDLLDLLARIVDDAHSTVLIQGESGTGKELVAKAIHYNGPRKEKPFVIVNCAALPDHLLESELFGYEKGAFTGAMKQKPGKFEVACGGTIFLDEVGEISSKVQVELLRFTQDHSFERIGSNTPVQADVRIIAATNRNLLEDIEEGRFRQDLFYRLNVIPINVPALRERTEDIPILIAHFIQKYHNEKGRRIEFSPETISRMQNYTWPGNIRELENMVERFIVTSPRQTILPSDLPDYMWEKPQKAAVEKALSSNSLKEARREFEKTYLLKHLEKHHWNIAEVARALNERRDTLSRKIKRYGLKAE